MRWAAGVLQRRIKPAAESFPGTVSIHFRVINRREDATSFFFGIAIDFAAVIVLLSLKYELRS